MYWWDRSAEILLKKGTALKRFGYVTTNSISQVFQRRVMEAYLNAKKPVSLVMAIPDHPWTKVTRDSAAVRIAMTVAQAGKHDGLLLEVTAEEGVETDSPVISFAEKQGKINSDLTVGVDVTGAIELKSKYGSASRGVTLGGQGFVVGADWAEQSIPSDERRMVFPYINGKDLNQKSRGLNVIDLFGYSEEEARKLFPHLYQHVRHNVYPDRMKNNRKSYRDNWWIFAEPRREIRPALRDVSMYAITARTAKHRIFSLLNGRTVCESEIVIVAVPDEFSFGVLSSSIHTNWSLRSGGWMGIGNDPRYSKSRCFDPFPFPAATEAQKQTIGAIAEELDAHRKRVLEDHPHLTLTGLYNVLERLKSGARPGDLDAKERRIFDDGLVLIIRELHERLDAAVADAYGWPVDLSEEEVLANLVALNKERAREEKRGLVRWLRPEYQIPRFGSDKEKAEQLEADLGLPADTAKPGAKPSFPTADADQTAVVLHMLVESGGALNASDIAARFKQGQKVRSAVASVLLSLYRLGLIATTDGASFSWRRVA